MFKRLRWLSTGMAVGLGSSFWLQRKMRSAASRYGPAGVAVAAANRARDALEEGRTAMREREAELRASSTRPAGSKSHTRRP
ncbi:MAG TPA: hypothetical protein VFN68_03450 [Acidimicrobiales bacterium]|nr:hypothetical protein [Acidimicrobiales bacterium]